MKNKFRVLSLIMVITFILFSTSACEQFGLFGQGGVPGDVVKEEILEADRTAVILNSLVLGLPSNLMGPVIVLAIVIDGAIVPSLAGIDEGKHYTRSSVDDCVASIKSVSVILGTFIGPLTCDLQTVPNIIQVGEVGI